MFPLLRSSEDTPVVQGPVLDFAVQGMTDLLKITTKMMVARFLTEIVE